MTKKLKQEYSEWVYDMVSGRGNSCFDDKKLKKFYKRLKKDEKKAVVYY